LAHDECRDQDDPAAGKRRGTQDVSIIREIAARNRDDDFLAIRIKQPPFAAALE
jgi:hypothetical protein